MARLIWLLLGAVVLVWAGVLFDFGGAQGRKPRVESAASKASGAEQRERVPAAQSPAPARAARAAAADEQRAPAALPSAEGTAPSTAQPPPKGTGSVAVIGRQAALRGAPVGPGSAAADPAVAADPVLPGEQGEGVLGADYAEAEATYIGEARDVAWALPLEQRVWSIVRGSPVQEELALVNCMETVCRIVLEADSNDVFHRLLAVPGLREATGLDATTPYSLRSGQLSVYFRPPR